MDRKLGIRRGRRTPGSHFSSFPIWASRQPRLLPAEALACEPSQSAALKTRASRDATDARLRLL